MVTTVINYHQILSSAESEKCTPCPKGGYCPSTTAKDGDYKACDKGTFNGHERKHRPTDCTECKEGGYCVNRKAVDGGFVACKVGHSNGLKKQWQPDACDKCLLGTYADKEGES